MRFLTGWRSRHRSKNRDKPIKYTVRVIRRAFITEERVNT
jgi:hypothetical protein